MPEKGKRASGGQIVAAVGKRFGGDDAARKARDAAGRAEPLKPLSNPTSIMAASTPSPVSSSGLRHADEDHKHKDTWLESIGKAIVAPIEGAQGGFTAAHPQPDQLPRARPAQSDARPVLPDRRDPRTVGDNGDGVLKAFGKAIVAPIAGAYEEAVRSPAPPSGRARQK